MSSSAQRPAWRFRYRDDVLVDQCLSILRGGWEPVIRKTSRDREVGLSVQAAIGPVSLGPTFVQRGGEEVEYQAAPTPESRFAELRSALDDHGAGYHDLTENGDSHPSPGDIVQASVNIEVPIFVKLAYCPTALTRTTVVDEDIYSDDSTNLSVPVAEILADEVVRAEPILPLYATGHGEWTLFVGLSAHPFAEGGDVHSSLLALEGNATLLAIVERQAPDAYLRAASEAPKQLTARGIDSSDLTAAELKAELGKLMPPEAQDAEFRALLSPERRRHLVVPLAIYH